MTAPKPRTVRVKHCAECPYYCDEASGCANGFAPAKRIVFETVRGGIWEWRVPGWCPLRRRPVLLTAVGPVAREEPEDE